MQTLVLAHFTFTTYQRSGGTDLGILPIDFLRGLDRNLSAGVLSHAFGQDLLGGLEVEGVDTTLGIMIDALYGDQRHSTNLRFTSKTTIQDLGLDGVLVPDVVAV